MITLEFTGPGANECFEIGMPHLTVRRAVKYPKGTIETGGKIRIVNTDTGRRGFAWVTGSANDVRFENFDTNSELIKLERSRLRTPEALKSGLREFYPDANADTFWTFIVFRTYISEIL